MRLLLAEINFCEINFCVYLFSLMQISPYFVWIYFRGRKILIALREPIFAVVRYVIFVSYENVREKTNSC